MDRQGQDHHPDPRRLPLEGRPGAPRDDPEKELKVGFRDPKRPNHVVTVAEAFQKFEPACEAAYAYVIEVSDKIIPRRKDWTHGHVVTDPVALEELLDP